MGEDQAAENEREHGRVGQCVCKAEAIWGEFGGGRLGRTRWGGGAVMESAEEGGCAGTCDGGSAAAG